MVDKNTLRAAFSARLHEALDDAGVRTRGRGMDIHRQLKSKGVDKTPQAISKWLNGEAIAEADSMVALCLWLKVRREWLEYGVPPKAEGSRITETSSVHDSIGNVVKVSGNFGKVPVISWVQAGAWCEAVNFEPYEVDSWISCPVTISQSGFALRVRGDSMTNPGPGRSYPAGCIIFVDPEIKANTGDRVIARVPRTNEVTFKVLVEDAGRQFLRPINPQYPIIDITEETHICGKVVGAFTPE
ncbi:peptidase S24 [Pseudomonas ogarae]|uniref:LexA family protein n=1 Tax=Pseudomonas ogarae (strain DSM 112162 / CECT 30235 / F113) TaxID=1114970 RepID=UPI0009A34C8C|nr:S24 family peptidase [Pseudomonas ogarae]OPG69331.1 peptidase S24 [Pseudomonas ogarae]